MQVPVVCLTSVSESVFEISPSPSCFFIFFFNDTATTEIYTLSLHDALPIFALAERAGDRGLAHVPRGPRPGWPRSEEHTSELQSRPHLVCRLLLEKKKMRNCTFTRDAWCMSNGDLSSTRFKHVRSTRCTVCV